MAPEHATTAQDEREALEEGMTGLRLTLPQYQALLDAYRDAAFWAGYEYRKQEEK